jgi:RNA-directed DNA polymerase
MLHDLTTNGIDAAALRHFDIKIGINLKQRDINWKIEVNPKQKLLFILRLAGYIDFIGQVRGKNDALYKRMKEEMEGAFA